MLSTFIRKSRGFTLTELLVVIAITGILLGLLFIPITNGFRLTRQAQNQVQAQGQARNGLEKLSRELAQASYVFDNSATPVVVPLKFNVQLGTAAPTANPKLAFTKLDLLAPLRGTTGGVIDPTTSGLVGGGEVRFPLAPGTRIVRYFLGLRDNTKPYENVYERAVTEFASDNKHNPLVLYRIEFSPNDSQLVNQNPTFKYSATDNQAGLNDPFFFYNTQLASNGRSYAANWKAKATMVVDGPNQDLLAWRKDDIGNLVAGSPMRPLVTFTPSTVVGDTATPGFLTAGNAEAPGAVPTLYTTQHGHWVLPCTLTVFRGSGAREKQPSAFGQLSLRIENEPQADQSTRLRIRKLTTTANEGSLTTRDDGTNFYTSYSPTSNKLLIKTPNLTFAVDLERGRIETGFPPYAGNPNGAPFFLRSGSFQQMQPGFYPTFAPSGAVTNLGDLIETRYQVSTGDPRSSNPANGLPTNQGIDTINLWNDFGGRRASLTPWDTTFVPRYSSVNPLVIGTYYSPLLVFGNVAGSQVNPGGGMLLAPGTESVVGPDLDVTPNSRTQVSYSRAAEAAVNGRSPILKKATLITDQLGVAAGNPAARRWSPITGQRNYYLTQDTEPHNVVLRFDEPNGPGLPARGIYDPVSIVARQLQVTFLWQNNFARAFGGTQNGWPMDAQGNVAGDKIAITPEPDVIKVDYATRDLLSISFGVNVYDSGSPTRQATSITLSDKVRIGNGLR